MPFSHKHKVIFIHVPKCGGTSVEQALNMYRWPELPECGYGIKNGKAMQHYLHSDYIEILGHETFSQYYKFAIVRNPYERFISEYYWCEMSTKTEIKNIGNRGGQDIDDFITYCESIVREEQYDLTPYHDHMMPQYRFIYDHDGKLMVDSLFMYEDYDKVKKMLEERFGALVKRASETIAPHRGSLELTGNQKRRVYNIYKQDFQLLGYKE